MTLRITIDIFSGRPNPVIEVDGKRAREILERLQPTKPLKRRAIAPEFRLGYRGLIIDQTAAPSRAFPRRFRVAAGAIYGPDAAHTIADPEFEEFFAGREGRAARLAAPRGFPLLLQREIKRLKQLDLHFKLPRFPRPIIHSCRCAPLYEPAWWNDGGQKQWNNNCYNYATNYRTDTFAQPGRA